MFQPPEKQEVDLEFLSFFPPRSRKRIFTSHNLTDTKKTLIDYEPVNDIFDDQKLFEMKINELSKLKVMKPETIFTVQRSSFQRSVKLKINRFS